TLMLKDLVQECKVEQSALTKCMNKNLALCSSNMETVKADMLKLFALFEKLDNRLSEMEIDLSRMFSFGSETLGTKGKTAAMILLNDYNINTENFRLNSPNSLNNSNPLQPSQILPLTNNSDTSIHDKNAALSTNKNIIEENLLV
ncbi:hypothetical protein HK099_006550, partial [Clydaea vesicula]